MAKQFSYLVDIGDVHLAEKDGKTVSEIQGMPFGEWEHPFYGTLKFDAEKLSGFAASVNQRVRDVDPDIDFDHKMFRSDAAAWVKSARVDKQDGLMLSVEWTSEGAKAVRDKAFRYFSPEFVDEWEHPKTGVKFSDVLFGGGITNRPFLKGIAPVNLSEKFAELQSEGERMDPKALRASLGLAEDATDDEVKAKLKEYNLILTEPAPTPPPPPTPPTPPATPPPGDPATPPAAPPKNLNDISPDDLRELFEANPAVAALVENHQAAQRQLHDMESALLLAEIDSTLAKYNLQSGKRTKLTPAFLAELKTTLLAMPNKDLRQRVYALANLLAEGKAVTYELGELGRQRQDSVLGGDPQQAFPAAVERKLREAKAANRKLSYLEAVREVSDEQPDLQAAYTAAMRS